MKTLHGVFVLGVCVSVARADVTLVANYVLVSISDDGRTAAGWLGTRSASWSRDSGAAVFGDEAGLGAINRASAISGDGQAFAGFISRTPPTPDSLYRWSGTGTAQSLGNYRNARTVEATGMSRDGSVIIGTSRADRNADFAAFIWSSDRGFRELVGVGHLSEATGVSDDGSTVCGWRVGPGGYSQAYLWSENGGVQALPDLGLGRGTAALAMSGDGRFIAGAAEDGLYGQACLWRDGEVLGLGHLSGYHDTTSLSVSNDGRIVTGYASEIFDPNVGPPDFVWTPDFGMEPIRGFLSHYGQSLPDLPGLIRYQKFSVSGDGRTLFGTYITTSGSGMIFVTIPQPAGFGLLVLAAGAPTRRRRER